MISCPNHVPKQHRDRRPAWCPNCGLTKEGLVPQTPQEDRQPLNPATFVEPPGYDEWIEQRGPVQRGYEGSTRHE